MKIVQTSNLHLGRYFPNCGRAGNRLRSALKRALTTIIDLSIEEKADLVIFAGDTFDSVDVSQSLLEVFIAEIKRLEKTPVVLIPGSRDHFKNGSFWEEWRILPPVENLYILTDIENPHVEIPEHSLTIYGQPPMAEFSPKDPVKNLKRTAKNKFHIAVIYGTFLGDKSIKGNNYPFSTEDLAASKFDYCALGGQLSYHSYTENGILAAYSGSPEHLTSNSAGSGRVLIVKLGDGKPTIETHKVGKVTWKEIEISMSNLADQNELISKIEEHSSTDTVLKVTLKGLALFEAGVDIKPLTKSIEDNFLHLEIIDKTNVLPNNISEVKVQEKTLLGQYLKVMVEKLKDSHGNQKADLEESLKAGYTLLSGKERW
jgi:exonuclease SbcD